jgi:NAD(P)H-binding
MTSVGRELVTQALAAGHEVTALVREPQGSELDERLAVIAGDATASRPSGARSRGATRSSARSITRRGRPTTSSRARPRTSSPRCAQQALDRLVVLSSPAVVDSADRPNLF